MCGWYNVIQLFLLLKKTLFFQTTPGMSDLISTNERTNSGFRDTVFLTMRASHDENNTTNGDVHSQCACVVVACPLLQTAQTQDSQSGPGCWGSSPFVANRFIRNEDVFLCPWAYRVCVSCVVRCITLLDHYGLWSDPKQYLSWKTEGDTHTHAGLCMSSMCSNLQIGSHVTKNKTKINCQTT